MNSINNIIDLALMEDIGPGDITTDNLVESDQYGTGIIIAKEPLVLAGLETARQTFLKIDPALVFITDYQDGDLIETGDVVLKVKGSLSALLKAERTALNFLQRLSGIATMVCSYLKELGDSQVRLTDTRKTTPGLRVLEKYAVRVGGGHNHRHGLYDGVLIKDNHIAVSKGIVNAVTQIRKKISHLIKIEVEVTDMEEVMQALEAGVDVIMLDNMDLEMIIKAVKIINHKAMVEVSGGITRANLNKLSKTGVDIISMGALTHSARSVDLSMRITLD